MRRKEAAPRTLRTMHLPMRQWATACVDKLRPRSRQRSSSGSVAGLLLAVVRSRSLFLLLLLASVMATASGLPHAEASGRQARLARGCFEPSARDRPKTMYKVSEGEHAVRCNGSTVGGAQRGQYAVRYNGVKGR